MKSGQIIEKRRVANKAFYTFGRSPGCDFILEHPSASRLHGVLQYRYHLPTCKWLFRIALAWGPSIQVPPSYMQMVCSASRLHGVLQYRCHQGSIEQGRQSMVQANRNANGVPGAFLNRERHRNSKCISPGPALWRSTVTVCCGVSLTCHTSPCGLLGPGSDNCSTCLPLVVIFHPAADAKPFKSFHAWCLMGAFMAGSKPVWNPLSPLGKCVKDLTGIWGWCNWRNEYFAGHLKALYSGLM